MHTVFPRHLNSQRSQAGLTLLGLAIAVALSAVIFAGLAYFVSVIISGNKTTSAVQDFDALQSNVQQLYQGNAGGFTNATQESLVQAGVVPQPLVSAGNLMTPFGTQITLQPSTDGSGTGENALQVSFPVPQAECTAFTKGVEANFGKVVVGGSTIKDELVGTAFSAQALSTACGAATGGTATVELYIVG
ncbi:MAG TPA: type 4 pilus major pilin [Rhodanobacteraceae bacterium]